MPPRLWQRQPGEAPADFTAFVAYLRLKGRRSHRVVAAHTGRSLATIRRLSAKFNWRARLAAFEARLADASQDALDLLVRASSARTTADYERLREAEFQLFQRVLRESRRWLRLASDPRRRDVSLGQVCQAIELATRLGRRAAGMPVGDELRRHPGSEGAPGGWTGPSAAEALEKIYGSGAPESGGSGTPLPDSSLPVGTGVPPETPPAPPASRPPTDAPSQPVPSNPEPVSCNPPPSAAGQAPIASPENPRRDA